MDYDTVDEQEIDWHQLLPTRNEVIGVIVFGLLAAAVVVFA
jgi:hypothetical protein